MLNKECPHTGFCYYFVGEDQGRRLLKELLENAMKNKRIQKIIKKQD